MNHVSQSACPHLAGLFRRRGPIHPPAPLSRSRQNTGTRVRRAPGGAPCSMLETATHIYLQDSLHLLRNLKSEPEAPQLVKPHPVEHAERLRPSRSRRHHLALRRRARGRRPFRPVSRSPRGAAARKAPPRFAPARRARGPTPRALDWTGLLVAVTGGTL
jgi:hypothetical protein